MAVVKDFMKDFEVQMMCSNCKNGSDHKFPFGTDIQRSQRDDGTKAFMPETDRYAQTVKQIECPHCGSERIQ